MKIKQLQIKNFLSIQKATIDFTNFDGLTVIKGKNLDTGGSNGAGKSAIIEAVYFALTGKTLRKSTEASLVNFKAGKGLEVSITLEVGEGSEVSVYRSKKPTKMCIVVDGQDVTAGHRDGSQARLEEIIGASHKVLAASMFFGQSNDLNFLDASPTVKRDIIRSFLNLEDLFRYRESIRDFKSEYSSDIKRFDTLMEQSSKDIASIQSKIDKSKVDLGITEEDLKRAWEDYHHKDKEYILLSNEVSHLQNSLKSAVRKSNTLKCDSCGSDLEVTTIRAEIPKLQKELDNALDLQYHMNKPESPEYTLEYLKSCNENTKVLEELKQEKLDSITTAQDRKAEAQLHYEMMRFWEKALSEKGVIKYVIRNILSYFNERINYYLSYLTDHTFSLKFDDELSENITIRDSIIHYISLSGGEKRKINLAVMMALKDLLLLTDTNHPDLLFFDEVAENIDEQGIQGLYNLLLDMKKDRQIFVITHNKHLKTLLDSSKRLTIEKREGISSIWHK
jgi:DNA repair exonuclease SbcCD ATPase subunit